MIITFPNISIKIRLTKFSQKRKKEKKDWQFWWGCIICGLPCPIKFLTRLTFLSFLWQLRSLILSLYELSSVPSHYQHCPHGTAYYHLLTMTQNFLCFFLLDILFHFCFALSSSSYINMCLHVHIHHSQFVVLCFIQSLLERF